MAVGDLLYELLVGVA